MSSAGACHAIGGGVNFLYCLYLMGSGGGGGGGGGGVVESLPQPSHSDVRKKM